MKSISLICLNAIHVEFYDGPVFNVSLDDEVVELSRIPIVADNASSIVTTFYTAYLTTDQCPNRGRSPANGYCAIKGMRQGWRRGCLSPDRCCPKQ